MLKYLDIARLLGAGVKCSACGSTRCEQSRWHSKHEREGASGFRPYRCSDCDMRFLAPSGAETERRTINIMAVVLIGFAAILLIEHWLKNADVPAIDPASLVSNSSPEKAAEVLQQAGADGELRMSGTLTYAKPDPAAPADEFDLLKKSAADGKSEAMVRLGRLLAAGEKMPKDETEAAKWIQLAASAGNTEGMLELGRYYRDGTGVKANAVRAYVWLGRAAAERHVDAMRERDVLVQTMSKEELKEGHDQLLPADGLSKVASPAR